MKKFVFGFKIYYLLNMLVAFTAFWNDTIWFQYSNYILVLGAAVGALYLLFHWKECMRAGNVWFIALFLVSYIFSSFMTREFGLGDNIKELIWLFLPMGFLYLSAFTLTKEERTKEIRILGVLYIIYCTVLNAVSVSMLWWGREYGIKGISGEIRIIGCKWGRLWGGYDDPNHGATLAVIAILLALYFIWTTGSRAVRVLLWLSVVIQYAYIIGSDSRTGFVTLAAGGGVLLYGRLYVKNQEKGRHGRVMAAAGAAMLAIVIVTGSLCLNAGYVVLDKKLEQAWGDSQPKTEGAQGNRNTDLKKDASSGRLSIWLSGLEIFRSSPVYGVSYRNMAAYAHKYVPDTYIVNTGYGIDYDSMHNMPLDVLVGQGIIGAVILCLVFGNSLRIFWVRIRKGALRREDVPFFALAAAMVLGLGAGSMFLTSILYLSGPHAYWFWLSLGSGVALLQEEDVYV